MEGEGAKREVHDVNKESGDEHTYKHDANTPIEHSVAYKEVDAAKKEILSEVEKEVLKFKDPTVLGALMYSVTREKENTNRLLKEVITRLERLEQRLEKIEGSSSGTRGEHVLLSDTDEQIVDYVKKAGKACAEEVQKALHYKGRNAASARLNQLFSMGLLEKAQVGRKVFYLPSGGKT